MALSNTPITSDSLDTQADQGVRATEAERASTCSVLNETTRTYPRTLEEAFPSNHYDLQRYQTWESYDMHDETTAEKYLTLTYAFAAGFVLAMIIFGG